jgi:hypothetical protein
MNTRVADIDKSLFMTGGHESSDARFNARHDTVSRAQRTN